MRGVVNAELEATIRINVRAGIGQDRSFAAIVDTGFNGALTLPALAIAELELAWRSQATVTLADGGEIDTDLYLAIVDWEGTERSILVEAAETEPLVGMALLEFHRLQMDVIDGGDVSIEPLRQS
jgi:clan AA aspartic protease